MVEVDFKGKDGSPFLKAGSSGRRLKLFLWGDSGTGKTIFSLRFPKPAIIDLEGGTEHYTDDFKFDVLPAHTPEEVVAAVDWLLLNQHDYRTLIIDPITLYWEAVQSKWNDIFLHRLQDRKGYKFEFYEMSPGNWKPIKAEFKSLLLKLIKLDMNVIVTARSKPLYEPGEMMKVVGETYDGDKSLKYLFDTRVHLFMNKKNEYCGISTKDRTGKLPQNVEFKMEYSLFEDMFGKKELGRKAMAPKRATTDQKNKIIRLIEPYGLTPDQFTESLAKYGVDDIDKLTKENADEIINKLETAATVEGGGA